MTGMTKAPGWCLTPAAADQAVRGLPRLDQVACGWLVRWQLTTSPQAGRFVDRAGSDATALVYAARAWAIYGTLAFALALALAWAGLLAAFIVVGAVATPMYLRKVRVTALSGRSAVWYRAWRGDPRR
jgi:hypothetical protein